MTSRNKNLALFLIISIFLVCGFLYILNISQTIKEGFKSSLENNYVQLQSSLQRKLEPYCSLTNFIQDQMRTMYKTSTIQTDQTVIPQPTPEPAPTSLPGPTKPSGFWGDKAPPAPPSANPSEDAAKAATASTIIPGASDAEADAKIRKAYEDAYACKDELADSRQSCAGFAKFGQINVKMSFIPCSVYLNTPFYDESDTSLAAIALSQIPDNLALRITKEVDWYAAIINKLQSGIDKGATPPKDLPPDAPGADYKAPPDKSAPPGAPAKNEGYADILEGFTLLHEGFKSRFSKLKDTVKSAAKKTGSVVGGAAKKAGGAVTTAAKKTGSVVGGAAKKAGGAVTSAAKKTGGAVVSAAKKTGGAVTTAAKKVGGAVVGAVGAVSAVAAKIQNPFRRNKPICSADAAREKRERERREKLDRESRNCTIEGLQSQIDRVNRILNSDALNQALARCAAVASAGQKLQSQLGLLKAGNLYDWQKTGPTKSYAQFKGGDRIAGLTFSIQQNRG